MAHVRSFNSKLVRLKAATELTQHWYAWFQFQTGSIKRVVETHHIYMHLTGFNSKLVRLEAPEYEREPDSDDFVSIPNWCD